MNIMSLAAKYLVRRKSRTIFILIVFLTINVMAFTVLSVGKAANDTLANLEEQPPDYFYLDSKYETDPDTIVAEGSTISFLSTPYPITDQIIEKVRSIHGIKAYAAHYAFLSGTLYDTKGSPMQLVTCRIPADESDAASIRGISDSAFYLGSDIKLTAGRHLTPDSESEAMVSTQFAKQNNLHTGDKLTIVTPGNTSGTEVTLSGLYETVDDTDESELSPSEISANYIYVDYHTALALDTRSQGTISVKFLVAPPDNLTAVFTEAQHLDIDWNQYSLFNGADESVLNVNSLKAVSHQFSILTAVILLGGFLVITLVLMFQTKTRTNETAIFLSLGFTKNKILLQHTMEAVIPAGISIFAAYFISGYFISCDLFHEMNLSVHGVQIWTAVQVIFINLSLLTASIWISNARILHAAPTTLFSKNN